MYTYKAHIINDIINILLLLLFYHFEYRDNNIDDKMHVINIFLFFFYLNNIKMKIIAFRCISITSSPVKKLISDYSMAIHNT